MSSKFLLCLLGLVFLSNPRALAQTMEVQIFERGTSAPLRDARVFLAPTGLRMEPDANGKVTLTDLTGATTLVVLAPGFKRYQKLVSELSSPVVVRLEREAKNPFETVVSEVKKDREVSRRSLTTKKFLQLPGAGGDPVKAVQNLPGINRASGFSSQVVIQGASARDTAYTINGHEVPLIFHFGGLTSVIYPEAVGQVETLTAGYSEKYSRALGGIVNLDTITNDQVKSDASAKGFFVDNLKAGARGRWTFADNSSLFIGGRYSYVGLFLGALLRNNEMVNLTVVPDFADLTVLYQKPLSAQSDFQLTHIFSRDVLGFLLKEPLDQDPSLRGTFKNETVFYRFIPRYLYRGQDGSRWDLSLGLGEDRITVDLGENFFDLKSKALTTRAEWLAPTTAGVRWSGGFDHSYSWADVKLRLPTTSGEGGVNNPLSSGELNEVSTSAKLHQLGFFGGAEWTAGDWLWRPGLRVDSFRAIQKNTVAPRLNLERAFGERGTALAAFGIYHQSPEPQELDDDIGNPDLKPPQALHLMLGFESAKPSQTAEGKGLGWGVRLFDRWFNDLVVRSQRVVSTGGGSFRPERFANEGAGRAFGVETNVKYRGWNLSYTGLQSRRWEPDQPSYPAEFDQTHILTLLHQQDLGPRWKLGQRFRYTTGNPRTAVLSGQYDADSDTYLPVRGPLYRDRFKDFFQWDVRFDRTWIRDASTWSLYFDIQNVLNTKNVETVRYAYDYSRFEEITGLPVIVSIGVEGRF